MELYVNMILASEFYKKALEYYIPKLFYNLSCKIRID
jgi:hypothetical protein